MYIRMIMANSPKVRERIRNEVSRELYTRETRDKIIAWALVGIVCGTVAVLLAMVGAGVFA